MGEGLFVKERETPYLMSKGKNKFKEALIEKRDFVSTLELVPGRGSALKRTGTGQPSSGMFGIDNNRTNPFESFNGLP